MQLTENQESTEEADEEPGSVSQIVAALLVAGSIVALAGLFILSDVLVTLVGIGIVFGTASAQAARARYRLRESAG